MSIFSGFTSMLGSNSSQQNTQPPPYDIEKVFILLKSPVINNYANGIIPPHNLYPEFFVGGYKSGSGTGFKAQKELLLYITPTRTITTTNLKDINNEKSLPYKLQNGKNNTDNINRLPQTGYYAIIENVDVNKFRNYPKNNVIFDVISDALKGINRTRLQQFTKKVTRVATRGAYGMSGVQQVAGRSRRKKSRHNKTMRKRAAA